MTAQDLLDRLEKQDLVDRAIISALRRKVSQPGKEYSARKVAKYLVQNGHLLQDQADRMLADEPVDEPAAAEFDEDDLIAGFSLPQSSKPTAATATDSTPTDTQPAKDAADKSTESSSTSSPSTSSKKRRRSSKSRKKKHDSVMMLGEGDLIEDQEGIVDLTAATESASPHLDEFDAFAEHDPLMDESNLGAADVGQTKKKKTTNFQGKRVVENQWDSKWILIGPTTVVVLGLAAAFLWFLLGRGDATGNYNKFIEAYKGQRYPEAITRGDKFLESFPRNQKVEEVRVFRGIARIRIPVESRQWEDALEQLETVLPDIRESEEFQQASDDVPFLILSVAEGFANAAESATETSIEDAQTLVEFADRTMVLAAEAEYIPSSQRNKPINEAQILRINEAIARTKYEIRKENTLVSRLADIETAINANNTEYAFEIRKQLIKEYQQVATDPRLQDAVLRISAAEQELVMFREQSVPPTADQMASAIVGSHVVATRTGETIPTLDGEVVTLLLNGCVYAFNAGTGEVLWRKYVDVATEYQPRWIDNQVKDDLLLANTGRNELIRVEAKTGEEKWRTAIGEAFAEPIISNDRAYLSTPKGNVIEVDLADGTSSRRVAIPQPLYVGPATGSRSKSLYQPGMHSNIYVLSSSTLQCQEVFYLGHTAGSIEVPPVLASDFLFVAENFPAGNGAREYSLVHILSPRADGIVPVQTPLRLEGRIVTPMVLYQRKVLLITNLGDIALLDVDVTSETRPVSAVAQFKLKTNPGQRDYLTAANGRLYVADVGMTGFSIAAQKGELDRDAAKYASETFVAPMHILGDHLFHARVRLGSTLVSVTAETAEQEPTVAWRTDIAAPLAGTPLVNEESQAITVVSAQGDQFTVTPDMMGGTSPLTLTQRGSTTLQDLVFTHLEDLGGGNGFAVGPGQALDESGVERRQLQCMAVDINTNTPSSRLFSRDMFFHQLAAEPVPFGNGMLIASTGGQVFLVDPRTGEDINAPFQPAIEPGVAIQWQRPAVIDPTQFVIADMRGNVYRIEAEAGEAAALSKTDELPLSNRIVSPLAAVGEIVYAVTEIPDGHAMVSITTDPLATSEEVLLPGRLVAGPISVGAIVLVITDDNRLHAFDASMEELWTIDVQDSTLAGQPTLVGDNVLIALNRGEIIQVSAADGEIMARIDCGEPILHSPIVDGNRWIVSAYDGTLLIIDPSRSSSQVANAQ